MRLKKQVLSLLAALLLLFNCFTVGYTSPNQEPEAVEEITEEPTAPTTEPATGEDPTEPTTGPGEPDEPTEPTAPTEPTEPTGPTDPTDPPEPTEPEEEQPPAKLPLSLTGTIQDAIRDMEYGWDGEYYRFDQELLEGVAEGHEVMLIADADTDGEPVCGDAITVRLSNFRLSGPDAEGYTLPGLPEDPVEKQIHILPKVITIRPADLESDFGQPLPTTEGNLVRLAHYGGQLMDGDDLQIQAVFVIENNGSTAVGTYPVSLKGEPVLVGEDAKNYTAVPARDLEYVIHAYDPDVKASVKDGTDGEFIGVDMAVLTAPEGFLIGGSEIGPWKQEYAFKLSETLAGKQTYYLRNNDPQSKHYLAVCSRQYAYVALQTTPTVRKLRLELTDVNTELYCLKEGAYASGNLTVTVTVAGGPSPQDITVYLGEEGSFDSVKVPASQAVEQDGRYLYTAVFRLECEEGQSLEKYLKAYATSMVGTGALYPATQQELFEGTETPVTAPVIIDQVRPVGQVTNVNGNHRIDRETGAILAQIRVYDADSGIAKVEYKWDEGFKLAPGDADFCREYVRLDSYSPDQEEYTLILPWQQAQKVEGNKHTLYLRITDRAGNVTDQILGKDSTGSDELPPQIESIELREQEDNSLMGKLIDYLSFGLFSSKTVQIAVKVRDNEEQSDYYASGVRQVWINEETATKNEETNEYLLSVSPNRRIHDLSVRVVDGSGNETGAYVADISKEDGIVSSCLIVENIPPVIDFGDFRQQGHEDPQGKVWFGISDGEDCLSVRIADLTDTDSGLSSILITDNGQQLYQASGLSSTDESGNPGMLADTAVPFTVGDFATGEHIITVTAVDNCGNRAESTLTFYVDQQLPEQKEISITADQAVLLDGQKWFRTEQSVTFRIPVADTDSGLKSIAVEVNGTTVTYGPDRLLFRDGEAYVETVVPCGDHKDHKITVSAAVTDYAGNTVSYEAVTAYVDTGAPVITKCTVQKKADTALDKLLKVLSFGIYANSKLLFRIEATDAEFDSGLASAQVIYAGQTVSAEPDGNEPGVFFFELSSNEAVFETTLELRVYDRYGNLSDSCTRITDAETGISQDSTYVMLETVMPLLSLGLPAGDGAATNPDQPWYRSNKVFELRVQDMDSGINRVSLEINGIPVTQDKNGTPLLTSAAAEAAAQPNHDPLVYAFDTNYLTAVSKQDADRKDGEYILTVSVTDNAGNVISNRLVYYLDLLAPRIDSLRFTPGTADGIESTGEAADTLVYGYFFNRDFDVTVLASDPGASSGLHQLKYRFVPYAGGVMQQALEGTVSIESGSAQLDAPQGFKGQLWVEAYDRTGNGSEPFSPMACVVDSAAPDIRILRQENTQYRDASGNPLYTQANCFTVTITDTVSGLKTFGYQQTAEKNPLQRQEIRLSQEGHSKGTDLGDGWIVTGVDANLVTQVQKTFTFPTDDNSVQLTFDAQDRASNRKEGVTTESFTVDTTAPVIQVAFREDSDSSRYYAQDRIADITVTERNFDPDLLQVQIRNTFGAVPKWSFTEQSPDVYTAVIIFDDGDYTFDLTGTDLGHHPAAVNFSGGNEKLFYVDKTTPQVQENFDDFRNEAENSFAQSMTAQIRIKEHHFDAGLVGLRIWEKAAGADHTAQGFTDVTGTMLKNLKWTHAEDEHTLSFVFDRDAVYFIEMRPADPAGNRASKHSTVVFEIDRTLPVVVRKNGQPVSADHTQLLELYPSDRKDEAAPTVEFSDRNLSHIEYELTTYIPSQISPAANAVKPVIETGTLQGPVYTLPGFEADGVYAVKLTAVDVAGNRSVVNLNTYARMVLQDVLAFIMDSDPAQKTGLFSLEYENGEPISKKPASFEDLKIFVLAPKEEAMEVVLRDGNGNLYRTDAHRNADNRVYGIGVYTYLLRGDYFRENFQEDADVELTLTVSNGQFRIDLAQIHIDSIAPSCTLGDGLSDWYWFIGPESRSFTVTHISEQVNADRCRVYDNGKEIPFVYSEETSCITFELGAGWHDVGIILVDMAGNANNIQEIRNIHIGHFWTVILSTVGAAILSGAVAVLIFQWKKRRATRDD